MLVLALVVTRSRGLLAGAEGRDVRRMWALGIASMVALWLIFRLTRPTALGGMLDPLVPQPLLVAAGLTLVWIGMRMRGRLPAALGEMQREASSSIDPDRARSARRLGVLALAAAVLGWLPLLRTFVVPSPSRGMGGDVAYGLAMIGLLGAGLMIAAGAIVGFVLATMAHRRDPDERFASVALGLASLTAGCVVAVLIWFRYFL